MTDFYEILGIARDATPEDIKRAFRQIARECHPDVAGNDPEKEERFKAARSAYEVLIDSVRRGQYDRRFERRAQPRGSFFDAFYRHVGNQPPPGGEAASGRSGPSYGAHDAGGHGTGRRAKQDPGNDVGLDDLFKDFGDFGFGASGGRRPRAGGAPRPSGRVNTGPSSWTESSAGSEPRRGDDVHVELEVPEAVARDGGTVTAVYHRMQRADSWRPGSDEPGVVRIQDIADVRVVPGTADGTLLRERGLGDAGPFGGRYGDLVVRLRVIADPGPRAAPPPREEAPRQEAPGARRAQGSATSAPDVVQLDISVVEALLGGRIELETPQGPVRLTIPAGTSGGTRLRLKGKGEADLGGTASDLYVQVRIVVPKDLDPESRRLIEEFARLNPE